MTSELQYQLPVKKGNWQMDKHSAGIIAVQHRNKDRYLPKGGGIAVDKSANPSVGGDYYDKHRI